MSDLKTTGPARVFETGAQRDNGTGKGRFDLIPPTALEKVAQHYEKGAIKYGEGNWRKGIPLKFLLDSAFRHLVKANRGDTDEDHLVAAAWNILCAIETRDVILPALKAAEPLPDVEVPRSERIIAFPGPTKTA